jgi:capsular polysaccharide biosynthesis protein
MPNRMRQFPYAGRRNAATPDSVDRASVLRLSERLHAFWRKAVRTPWRNARRAMRRAMTASSAGIPVSVDDTTQLAVVPYEGRFPPPLAECVVVEPSQYRTKLHPLSVNSTTTERVHYIDHTVDAPAMTLEHLVDQYWFPALGLMISPQGRIWRHSFLGPFQDGFLTSIKAIVDRARPDGAKEHRLYLERLARAPVIASEHLVIAGSDKPNFGHYLLDIAPLIHLGATMGVPMLSWTLRPWQRALIARRDVAPGLIREIRPRPVFLKHAIVSNRLSGVSSQNAHPQHREAFGRILENVRRRAPAMSTPERVLICRSLANSRNLTNRAAMIEALKALGFVAVQPEKLEFDEQVLLFAQADAIVCEFGAAMANAMFCKPGTKVVEIIAEGQQDPWSAHLCAMLGLEHVVLFESQSEEALASMPRHMKDSPFSYAAHVPRLVETVRALMDGEAPP